ncbi:uncharacterized protein LOC125756672 [Rhipicephalus sanguineus]|uniref:uncharacterized protein LOC125756672 n=1 Tax=Rhipicephalus sanguineus TaxID=34632 RepID=UPI0020C36353|nr:uncharacterized protein LOC125756672 [Rhipicephalus sanguineus]
MTALALGARARRLYVEDIHREPGLGSGRRGQVIVHTRFNLGCLTPSLEHILQNPLLPDSTAPTLHCGASYNCALESSRPTFGACRGTEHCTMAHSSRRRSSQFVSCFTTSVFGSSCLSQTTSLALKNSNENMRTFTTTIATIRLQ